VHRRIAALTDYPIRQPSPTSFGAHHQDGNTPQAHPQYGINEADVVYEEIVERRDHRLAAIFNSNLPTKVGPVRSVRRTIARSSFP